MRSPTNAAVQRAAWSALWKILLEPPDPATHEAAPIAYQATEASCKKSGATETTAESVYSGQARSS